MFLKKKFEERIAKKEEEIESLERQLGEARAYLTALQDSMKLFPKDNDGTAPVPVLRAGTDVAKAQELILQAGKPMHVNELLKGMGKEVTKAARVSLAGSLGGYVRRTAIFTKPQPNTFGLIELHQNAEFAESAPPDDFGLENGVSG
jgi:hypothetical protein